MNFAFGSPLMLATAALGAAVIAVYIFHRRPREQEVSSLLLWQGIIRPGGAGRQREQFRAPWLLAIELLVILLLALAAASPLLTASASGRSLIVVLDNSFSMTAEDNGVSSRDRAEAQLLQILPQYNRQRTAFVLASDAPALISIQSRDQSGRSAIPTAWTCSAPTADLLSAIRLALEIDSGTSDILVLTDHEPDVAIDYGPRVRWLAFGQPLANIAITAASRSSSGAVTLEVTNASDRSANRTLTIESPGTTNARAITIGPGSTSRLRVPAAPDAEVVIRITPPDALPADDSIRLVPEDFRPLRVGIRTDSDSLRQAAERWVRAEPTAQMSGPAQPELLITDDAAPSPPGAWTVRIQRPAEDRTRAFSGPYISNREHEIAEGLDLSGVIWATDLESETREADPPGLIRSDPVLILSTRTVIEEQRFSDGRHELVLHLDPERSNLTSQLAWPILLSNAARLRTEARPGPTVRNAPVGRPIRISALPGSTEPILVLEPGGEERQVRSTGAAYTPPQPGLYTIRVAQQSFAFAANLLAPSESDLRRASTATLEPEDTGQNAESFITRELSWIASTLALLLIAAHGLIVWRTYQRGGSV